MGFVNAGAIVDVTAGAVDVVAGTIDVAAGAVDVVAGTVDVVAGTVDVEVVVDVVAGTVDVEVVVDTGVVDGTTVVVDTGVVGASVDAGVEDVGDIVAAAPPSVDSVTCELATSVNSVVSVGAAEAADMFGSLVSPGSDDSAGSVDGAEPSEVDVATVVLAARSGSVVPTTGLTVVSVDGTAAVVPIDELEDVDDVNVTASGSALAPPERAGPTKNHPTAPQHTVITVASAIVQPRLRTDPSPSLSNSSIFVYFRRRGRAGRLRSQSRHRAGASVARRALTHT